MALTESEAKVLGVLSSLGPTQAATVRQLCEEVGLTAETVRRVLRALSRDSFAVVSHRSPPQWRATSTGRRVMKDRPLREYVPRAVR